MQASCAADSLHCQAYPVQAFLNRRCGDAVLVCEASQRRHKAMTQQRVDEIGHACVQAGESHRLPFINAQIMSDAAVLEVHLPKQAVEKYGRGLDRGAGPAVVSLLAQTQSCRI